MYRRRSALDVGGRVVPWPRPNARVRRMREAVHRARSTRFPSSADKEIGGHRRLRRWSQSCSQRGRQASRASAEMYRTALSSSWVRLAAPSRAKRSTVAATLGSRPNRKVSTDRSPHRLRRGWPAGIGSSRYGCRSTDGDSAKLADGGGRGAAWNGD